MHYEKLINRAKERVLNIHTESHHIVPRCMGGIDDKDNLVDLTPEEHYTAHQLLIKIFPTNYKLIHAASMMCVSSVAHKGKRSKNKLYGWIKRRMAIAASINSSGINGSQYGTCWIHSIEKKTSRKIPKNELEKYLEIGWIAGRIINFNKPEKIDKRQIIKNETDKRYLEALLKSSSISGALRSLGLQTRGAGYERMKRVIVKNNLQEKFNHDYIRGLNS
jgi:hypothetical protein